MPLAWNPAWHQPGMSVWALACRIAHATTATVRSVLEYFVGADERHRAPVWFRSKPAVDRLAGLLDLPVTTVRDAFLYEVPSSLYEREHYRLGVRWCSECLSAWYHSPRFQDVRLRSCPVHGRQLLERCQRCQRAIDPIGVLAWSCTQCGSPMTAMPPDWLDDFKRPAAFFLPSLMKAAKKGEGGERRSEDGTTLFVPTGIAEAVGQDVAPGFEYADDYRRRFHVFEDACGMWDTFAREHRACAAREHEAGMTQYSPVRFECPVAAAMLQAMGALGVVGEPRGGWPGWRPQPGSTCDSGMRMPRHVPNWLVPAFVREAGRHLVLDALNTVGELAEMGQRRSHWLPDDSQEPQIVYTPEGALLSGLVTESLLLKAANRAAKSCPNLSAELRKNS